MTYKYIIAIQLLMLMILNMSFIVNDIIYIHVASSQHSYLFCHMRNFLCDML